MFLYAGGNPLNRIDNVGLNSKGDWDKLHSAPPPPQSPLILPTPPEPEPTGPVLRAAPPIRKGGKCPGEIVEKWGPAGAAPSELLGGEVAGRPRVGGIRCTCAWERVGWLCIYWGPCGKKIVEDYEPDAIISSPSSNFATTRGWMGISGCSCSDPNGNPHMFDDLERIQKLKRKKLLGR